MSTVFTFLLILLVGSLCWAQDVTLELNDGSFITAPPNWWGGQLLSPLCGGTRWTSEGGQAISLAFTGIAITVNFLLNTQGAYAAIFLNGSAVTQLSTYAPNVRDSDCRVLPWSSGRLPEGQHTIRVTQLGPGDPSANSTVYVWFRSFVYTPSPHIVASPNAPVSAAPAAAKRSTQTGIIIGVAIGGAFALLLAGYFLVQRSCRRSRVRAATEKVDLNAGEKPTGSLEIEFPPSASSRASGSRASSTSRSAPVHAPLRSGSVSSRAAYTESIFSVVSSSVTDGSKYSKASSPAESRTHLLRPPAVDQRLTETQLRLLQRLADRDVPGPQLAAVIQSMSSPSETSPAQAIPSPSRGLPDSPTDEPPPSYNVK